MTEVAPGTNGRRERVAIFGGAFDPFHRGHIAAIKHLLTRDRVDRVLVIPSGDRPDKPHVSAASDRLEMARRGILECFVRDARVEVSGLQVSGSVGYATIDLVSHFLKNQSIEPLIVIGQELIKDLSGWKNAAELKKIATFLVLRRPGFTTPEPPAGWHVVFSAPFGSEGLSVSSTELRARLAQGERCEDSITERVYDYCHERGLYGIPAKR